MADPSLVDESHLMIPKPSGTAATAANLRAEPREGSLLASKYRLVKQLGTGGMGTVWLATNETLDSDVAIKLIRKDLDEPVLTLRLMAEARAIARLGHPNIVRVFDVGQTAEGQPFIVMELLRGHSLGFKIRREGRMPAAVAVQTLLPIAHALVVTHEEGIVHRDLKPDNIVLEERDDLGVRPVLVDFGIAKTNMVGAAKLTQDGATLGSPEYMSPEQARGDQIDARADMWAFCVLLYESLLGHVPFTDTNYHRLLRRIIDEPIPSFSRVGIQDDDLWAIIDKGLRKNPDERFENMRSLGVSLARWLLDLGITEDASHASVRATWLQGSPPGTRKTMISGVDSAETLASIPSRQSPRPSLVKTLRKKYLVSRVGWFAAIFLTAILLTLLVKPWIKRNLPRQPLASTADTAMNTAAPPQHTAQTSAARVADIPGVAAVSVESRGQAAPASPVASLPKSSVASQNAPATLQRPTSQRAPAATQAGAPASAAHSNIPPAARSAAPGKLDIKTDF
jgi:serine/threonine-protein kinase